MYQTAGIITVIAFIITALARAGLSEETIKRPHTWKELLTAMEFVFVKGGCYDMGCEDRKKARFFDESPVHEVCLEAPHLLELFLLICWDCTICQEMCGNGLTTVMTKMGIQSIHIKTLLLWQTTAPMCAGAAVGVMIPRQ